ncbi:MAG: hypothetical protein KGP29_04080 [Proteobacteria bacterium]|nr:hypothetical protein [Pseudomonadota bacterium]
MAKDFTVLVVGAGANADFKLRKEGNKTKSIAMPTGEDLVGKIADWEGQVLPNLYWGFIAKIAAKYCEEPQIEEVADLVASHENEHNIYMVSTTEIGKQIALRIKNDFKSELFFGDLSLSGFVVNRSQTNKNVAEKIKIDDQLCWYYKISEIVKHYQPFSIDEMLDSIKIGKIDITRWSNDNEEIRRSLIQAGKDLIALFLLQSEDKKVFDYESSCWYRHLRSAIINCGKNKREIEEELKNFVIISFNYDRSLDYFLRTRVGEFYDKIRVIYPYGSLAENEVWNAEKKDYQKIPYASAENEKKFKNKWKNFQQAQELAKTLEVIGELEEIEKGKKKIAEVEKCVFGFCKIYFLGFAFHEENCRIMGMLKPKFEGSHLGFLRALKTNPVFYTNFGDSSKIKDGFDSVFNSSESREGAWRRGDEFFEIGRSSKKGTYDALSQDFDLRLYKV